jgi:fengycin family lipopeptide synthetase D
MKGKSKMDIAPNNSIDKACEEEFWGNTLKGEPSPKISHVEFLSPEEKHQLLYEFNNTKAAYQKEKTIHQLIEEQVRRTPNSTALVFGDKELTYEELNTRANYVAKKLREEGVGKDCIVGILINRSLEMIIGILGILKSGGAYLPIDPEYPYERIDFMIKDSEAKVLLTTAMLRSKTSFDGKSILLDEIDFDQRELENLEMINNPGDLAYVIYTSGSTGKPKGVMISHQALNNFIKGISGEIDFSQGKSILAVTTMCFDIFALESHLPLSCGMKIVIADEKQQMDAKLLGYIIRDKSVDIVQMTPSRMKLLVSSDTGCECLKCVKEIIIGGEVFPPALLSEIRKLTNAKVFNVYGPTETTVWCTIKELNTVESINIGKPLANTCIYIVDRNNNLVPIGVQGELCIGGDSLARGYLNRMELNVEKFVSNPFKEGERMYRTGDLARWLPDGNIEFIGRVDRQTKIRGYRVELGEIENQIVQYPAIKDAFVNVEKSGTNKDVLCAYIVLKDKLNLKELREFLESKLPIYMVPAFFIKINEIPLTVNGKIDTKSLPYYAAEFLRDDVSDLIPEDDIEITIINICKRLLGIENIKVYDNFFDLGGDSLGVLLFITEIYNQFGVDINYSEAFRFKNLKEASQLIRNSINKVEEYIKVETKHNEESLYKVSFVQANLIRGMAAFKDHSLMNMPFSIDFGNQINIKQLEKAFNLLIQRHEILRTSFHKKGSKYVQMIHKDLNYHIEYLNINNKPWEKAIKENIKPFDISKTPLFKIILMENIEGKQKLFVNFHHFIFDIFSLNILLQEIISLYQEKNLPEVQIQYKDYSERQLTELNSKGLKDQKDYWVNLFKGWISEVSLKKDFNGFFDVQLKTDNVEVELDEYLTKILKNASLKMHTTEFIVLFSAYSIFLSKQTGLEDIVIGTFVPGRKTAQTRNLLGLCTNIVAVRTYPSIDKTIEEYVKEVKEFFIDMYNYQDYPLEKLLEDLSYENCNDCNELFTMMFDYINLNGDNLLFYGNKVKISYLDNSKTAYDLHFRVVEQNDIKKLVMQYNSMLFKRSTIENFLSGYLDLLKQVCNCFEKKLKELSPE